MSDERRGSPRLAASLAGEISTAEGKSSIAISRDVSPGGLMIFARSRLIVGSKIKLMVVHEGQQLNIDGIVLRIEQLEPGESTLWRTRVAIATEEDDPVLTELYAALAASGRQSN